MTQAHKAPITAPVHVARPKGQSAPAPPQPCERELAAKNAENARLREELAAKDDENARLKEQVAKLERRLGVRNKIETPHAPVRPHGDMGP